MVSFRQDLGAGARHVVRRLGFFVETYTIDPLITVVTWSSDHCSTLKYIFCLICSFTLKNSRRMCADPELEWVQRHMKSIDQNQNKTSSSPSPPTSTSPSLRPTLSSPPPPTPTPSPPPSPTTSPSPPPTPSSPPFPSHLHLHPSPLSNE
ncbi:hypothetical protein HF521_020067 [Silurus meridionalis]|uniref:Chemokine interleukin-8-like domain-containing protein n=1 Tax=Silurus meridionalis TaxID=175797 RepID=A0A8T0BKU8_SILME|nr:hypothetical protein HF521_020067 [Silurus meridionalis]